VSYYRTIIIAEKSIGWYISLQKIQAKATVPKHFLQAYSQMLHLKKKRRIRDGRLTNITNKHERKDRQCTPRWIQF